MSERFFSPGETARRLGVGVRALRLYERKGLVAPARTEAGWRVYGPGEIERLRQVLALKSLGLSLARITELLAGRPSLLPSHELNATTRSLPRLILWRRKRTAPRSPHSNAVHPDNRTDTSSPEANNRASRSARTNRESKTARAAQLLHTAHRPNTQRTQHACPVGNRMGQRRT